MFVYATEQGKEGREEASSIYWFISLCRRLCFVQLISNDFSLAEYFQAHRAKEREREREREGGGEKKLKRKFVLYTFLFATWLG